MRGWGSLGPPFALFCCSQGEEGHQWNTKMREKMGKVEERREGMKQTSGKGKTRMDQGSTTQVPSTRASVMFTVMDLTWNLWAWLYVFLQESTADEHKRWAIGSFSFGSFLMQWFKCFENERSTSNSYVCPFAFQLLLLPHSFPSPHPPSLPSSLLSKSTCECLLSPEYSRPLNNTGLDHVSPLICKGFFLNKNIGKFFGDFATIWKNSQVNHVA